MPASSGDTPSPPRIDQKRAAREGEARTSSEPRKSRNASLADCRRKKLSRAREELEPNQPCRASRGTSAGYPTSSSSVAYGQPLARAFDYRRRFFGGRGGGIGQGRRRDRRRVCRTDRSSPSGDGSAIYAIRRCGPPRTTGFARVRGACARVPHPRHNVVLASEFQAGTSIPIKTWNHRAALDSCTSQPA
jgi:hypothetical protein